MVNLSSRVLISCRYLLADYSKISYLKDILLFGMEHRTILDSHYFDADDLNLITNGRQSNAFTTSVKAQQNWDIISLKTSDNAITYS
jgi:hypothetical protein